MLRYVPAAKTIFSTPVIRVYKANADENAKKYNELLKEAPTWNVSSTITLPITTLIDSWNPRPSFIKGGFCVLEIFGKIYDFSDFLKKVF